MRGSDAAEGEDTGRQVRGRRDPVGDGRGGLLAEAELARIDLLRAEELLRREITGNVALPLLLAAARRLEPLDPVWRGTLSLDALSAALFAGVAVGPGAREVRTPSSGTPPEPPRERDSLLEGLAIRFTDGMGSDADVTACRSRLRLGATRARRGAWCHLVRRRDRCLALG